MNTYKTYSDVICVQDFFYLFLSALSLAAPRIMRRAIALFGSAGSPLRILIMKEVPRELKAIVFLLAILSNALIVRQ